MIKFTGYKAVDLFFTVGFIVFASAIWTWLLFLTFIAFGVSWTRGLFGSFLMY